MPTSWELDIYAMDDEHAEFKQFVKKGRTSATQKLLDMAARFHALDTDSPVDNNHSIFSLMAYVNDYYHEVSRKGPAITKEETVAIIRAGFEEMGYEFEFIPMEQAA